MRLLAQEVEGISKFVVRQLKKSGVKLTEEGRVAPIVVSTIKKSIEDEEKLEEEALALLKQHRKSLGASLDETKALRMIKEKLAKERGFVL